MAWLHAVIDVPETVHAASAEFWGRAVGWPPGDPWRGHPELRSFEPTHGDAYLHLQLVDGPPRVHPDVEADDPPAIVEQAMGAGGSLVHRFDRWTTMLSPGGLPFCVLPRQPHVAPQPVRWPDGQRSRLVQVCIDSPGDRHDAEVSFWRSLLGHRWVDSASPEFAGKWHDDAGSPIQLLFQRLEEPAGRVRAHLDLGTDGVPAEIRRLLAAGADDVAAMPGGWHVLRDPAGLPMCVTGNAPDQTRQRELD